MHRMLALAALLLCSTFATAAVKDLSNDDLKALVAAGVPVIDIRRADEWQQTGVVPGSHLITFFDKSGKYDLNAWMASFSKVVPDPNQEFVLICRTGNRTGTVAKFLDEKLKYTKVAHVKSGITSWIATGNPVAKPNP